MEWESRYAGATICYVDWVWDPHYEFKHLRELIPEEICNSRRVQLFIIPKRHNTGIKNTFIYRCVVHTAVQRRRDKHLRENLYED